MQLNHKNPRKNINKTNHAFFLGELLSLWVELYRYDYSFYFISLPPPRSVRLTALPPGRAASMAAALRPHQGQASGRGPPAPEAPGVGDRSRAGSELRGRPEAALRGSGRAGGRPPSRCAPPGSEAPRGRPQP